MQVVSGLCKSIFIKSQTPVPNASPYFTACSRFWIRVIELAGSSGRFLSSNGSIS